MKVELQGATVCVVGRIKGWSKNSIKRTLDATGGALVGMPQEGCLVLVGSNPSWYTLDRARARVCTILEGEDALALLADGAFELPEEPPRAFGELVAQARALFDRPPSLEVFDSLTAFLDACPPEHAEDLTRYVTPQLAEWGPAMLGRDTAFAHADRFAWRHTGRCADAGGSMRAMPNRWIVELIDGGPAAKHRVCDTLTFTGLEVSSALAAGIFDHGPLEHLRAFSPGRSAPRYRKTIPFYRRMVKSDALAHVTAFTLTECASSAFDVIMKHPEFLPNLTTLCLDGTTWRLDGSAALAGLWGAQLEALKVSTLDHILWLRDHRRELTALSDLVIELPDRTEQHHVCLPDVVEGVGSLTLAAYSLDELLPAIEALATRPPELLRTLDLSPITHPSVCEREHADLLGVALATSGLCEGLERVVLNSAFDGALAASLEDLVDSVEVLALQ